LFLLQILLDYLLFEGENPFLLRIIVFFYEIRGVIVRVYNYEKLSLISENNIDEVFYLIGVHVDLIGLVLIERK